MRRDNDCVQNTACITAKPRIYQLNKNWDYFKTLPFSEAGFSMSIIFKVTFSIRNFRWRIVLRVVSFVVSELHHTLLGPKINMIISN